MRERSVQCSHALSTACALSITRGYRRKNMNNFEEEHFMPGTVDEQIEHYLSQQVDPNRTPERQTVQELQQHYAPPVHDDQQEQVLSRVWQHLVQQDASLPALSSAMSEAHTLPLPVIRANQQERRTAPSAPS